ncbi:37S ribosomal S5, mitochondrial [Lecanosticta acicola]|uniref:Small ribosomal subunit protein uS5m n=1 Tax=Lecanosticta acicola TaxID=111012 RepID=A0AAI8Z2Q7_9PEZI|nr:37S ribosomal S5, mitochondrial [Lecanosticta acicola]
MSSTRTYQCLSCRLKSAATNSANNARRAFHTTRPRASEQHPNVSAKDMGLTESETVGQEVNSMAASLRPYTERELQLLRLKYTPEQMKAIRSGESAIDPEQMMKQGRFRTDPMRIDYIDDFATVRPLVDVAPPSIQQELDAIAQSRAGRKSKASSTKKDEEEDPRMLRLMQQTGLTKEEIRRLRVKNLVTHRVVNQTRMGKIQSLYFLTIAGNQDGMLGIGEGKAAEDEDGRRQAMMNAIRNMKPIPRYEERTIFGEVEAKVGAAVVKLSSRPPGFGNRCQHLIFEMARAAGITDIAARTPRSRNKMNVVKAAFEALMNQRLPEDIARARGRKMVDVRGVYYGGLVH